MNAKILVLFAVLCVLGSCWGVEDTTQSLTRHENIPIEPIGVSSDPDINQDASFWRFWKFWKWGRSMLKNVFKHSSNMAESAAGRHRIHQDLGNKHSDRTNHIEPSPMSTGRDSMMTTESHLLSDSGLSYNSRITVQKEIVTLLFESMLPHIVQSWKTLKTYEQPFPIEKQFSDILEKKRGGKGLEKKTSKTRAKNRSKLDVDDKSQISDPMQISWWSSPDEKALITFKNGNVYEGDISMKVMHGEGRFQWADGTVYEGNFKDNEIAGKGLIHFCNDTWYQGEFLGNVRHGKGLYVDSRTQRSYYGGWLWGTKHGEGVIQFTGDFKNSYDGAWVQNVRHGFGTREYDELSGYQGDWDFYVRNGKGLAIFPNHDLYEGHWTNGIMSDVGFYIWDTPYNNSMAAHALQSFRGQWKQGDREGFGVLTFGVNLGSYFKGEFKDNKKHGAGKLVSNNGLIIQSKHFFDDDNIALKSLNENVSKSKQLTSTPNSKFSANNIGKFLKAPPFPLYDSEMGLRYHVLRALNELDRRAEVRKSIINEYIANNRFLETDYAMNKVSKTSKTCRTSMLYKKEFKENNIDDSINEDLIVFETKELFNTIMCYEPKIKSIYYQYATICNKEKISFTPILIRLYLWQFYYDCDMHEKGFTFIQIDEMFIENPNWLTRSAYGPFDEIYLWQFLHGIISIARSLYAKKTLPGPKPDTIMANAFRKFMDTDAIPCAGRCKGFLTESYGTFVPLNGLYKLYCSLGEPHTIRKFLCAVRYPPHLAYKMPQPELVEEINDGKLLLGRNVFLYGEEMSFVPDDNRVPKLNDENERSDLLLFNFGNLSSKTIISFFAEIFPQLIVQDHIMDLEINITFFEFFQVFMMCTEESIRVKDEEIIWREMFIAENKSDNTLITNK